MRACMYVWFFVAFLRLFKHLTWLLLARCVRSIPLPLLLLLPRHSLIGWPQAKKGIYFTFFDFHHAARSPSLSLLFMSKCNFPPIIYFFISLSLFSQFCRRGGWCGSSMVTLRIDSGTSAEYARARAKSCYSKGGRKKKNAACNITTTTQEILPNQLFAVFIIFLWTWGVSAPSS